MSKALIGLPASRAAQLKSIAAVRGLSVNDLLTAIIRSSVEAGEIADQTPDFEIEASGEGSERQIVMHIEGEPMPPISAADALDVAASLEVVAARPRRTDGIFAGPHFIQIKRVGVGIAIEFSIEAKRPIRATVPPSVAKDIARQIRKAIA